LLHIPDCIYRRTRLTICFAFLKETKKSSSHPRAFDVDTCHIATAGRPARASTFTYYTQVIIPSPFTLKP
jgi:hypothetical protein